MSLDALVRLQAQYNDRERQGVRELGQNIGNILNQRGMADFERNAMNILKAGASPEKMQQLSSMYPNIPQREIWKYASEVGKQVDAQKLKDVFRSFQSWIKPYRASGKAPSAKEVQAWMEPLNLTQGQEQVVTQHYQKMIEFSKIGEDKYDLHNVPGLGALETKNKRPTGKVFGAPEEEEKTPTPSMYSDKELPDGMIQKMKWNPKTQKHDIPYGKPYKKSKTATGWQRKTRTYIDDGKQYKQDYDYNPKTREEKLVGEPYETKDVGSAIMQWLNKTDPEDLF